MPSSPPAAPGLGVALYLLGVFFFALNDALGKWLVADYGVGQMVMLRSIGAAIVLAPMIASMGVDLFDFSQWRLQIVAHPRHGGRHVLVLSSRRASCRSPT